MEGEDLIDVAFAIDGGHLPAEYPRPLAEAIEQALPWAADTPELGVHPLKLARGGGEPLLSGRTRLTLRLPRERASDAARLSGASLQLRDGELRLGDAHVRELLPWGTLYAHCVAAEPGDDELAFLQSVQSWLEALDIDGRAICGLARRSGDGARVGYGLMVDRLSLEDSMTLQRHGIGSGRRLGFGLFLPHKSAAAVGAAP